ncbi:DoxX family protein [Rhodobium gokarnense]|uniref:Oxidoreductase n=1 Tax=Rhodobium gokarnense TaxID=364296 RepID=A0ABT3H6S1_9HYPH|nr:DoxX family protein [Rhodobium gokarnense]MCW2306079.1 putative oxidoreductase [Rhodobium gokarnense]
MLARLVALQERAFAALERALGPSVLPLIARLVFASALLLYYLNSAYTKVGSGFPEMFVPQVGAYAQIVPKVAEGAGYDVSQIAFFPYGLIVWAGTYAEFFLPVLIVLGLFTRLASLGMIGFIVVQSIVDVTAHGLDAATIGLPFDRFPDGMIADQRLFWVFVLVVLVLRGGGRLSLDGLLARRERSTAQPW